MVLAREMAALCDIFVPSVHLYVCPGLWTAFGHGIWSCFGVLRAIPNRESVSLFGRSLQSHLGPFLAMAEQPFAATNREHTLVAYRAVEQSARRYGAAIWSRYMPHRVLPICCSCCVYFVVLSCEYVPQPGARRAGVVYVFGSKPVPIA